MVISILGVMLTVLVAMFLFRLLETLLLRQNPNSAIGQGLAFIIG